ncbi:hypothetical protein HK102_005932 [Quaeritorhiza haematococci]|nr:hypothetical protein HK102_005932 [Quaeritorhiza haematococci]
MSFVEILQVGATEIEFEPGAVYGGTYTGDTQTAGSITLLLQTSLPVLLYCPSISHVTLKGGTNAIQAPQIDYVLHIFKPFVEKHFGLNFDVAVKRRGYYPKGGGLVDVDVRPVVDGGDAEEGENEEVIEKGGLRIIDVTRRGDVVKIVG